MERFLILKGKGWRYFFLAVAIAVISAMSFGTAYAATYSGWWTGYAMGNRYGASGYEVYQGDFANHPPNKCPNDPAAFWAWGTQITLSAGVAMQDQNGLPVIYHYFYLYDNGDPTCSQGNYWVDVYFGRYLFSGQSCNCPGSPSPGYCIVASTNSCTQAQNFGRSYKTYTKP
jgi:hypothetical protein